MARNMKTAESAGVGAGAARRGFTLVEVIVVAVIVLILSAVAIPMYNGFVRQAREEAVQNLAETAAAAANSYWRKTGQEPPDKDVLKLHYDVEKHDVTIDREKGMVTVEEVDKTPPISKSVSFKN